MRHNIIFFILLALAMSSCEYELDFSGYDKTRRLFVFGMPGSSDTTVVRLYSTIPMGDRNSSPLPLDDAGVSLIVNGEEIAMERADGTTPSLPAGSFYTLYTISPGDKVEIKASAEGAESAWAESTVPEIPAGTDIVMEAVRDAENNITGLTFSAGFKDDSDAADYYAMQVYVRREYYEYTQDGGYEVQYYEYELLDYEVGDGYDDDLYPFRKPIIVNYNSGADLYSKDYAPMVVFAETAFENGVGAVDFHAGYRGDRIMYETYMDDVLLERRGYVCSYRAVLYRLSSELYNFIRANEILNVNMPILIGAAPPSYSYTNIRGGVGVFGGLAAWETEWIPNK